MSASDYLSRLSPDDFKRTAGTILVVVGAAIVIIQGIAIWFYGGALMFVVLVNGSGSSLPLGLSVTSLGLFEVVTGAFMLAGAYLTGSNYFKIIGVVIILIFSGVSLALGGGWILGSILGLCGGILSLFRKRDLEPTVPGE